MVYKNEAAAMLARIDRSVLGSFAADADMVVLKLLIIDYQKNKEGDREYFRDLIRMLSQSFDDAGTRGIDVNGEAVFWAEQLDILTSETFIVPEVQTHCDMLKVVAAHPDLLGFFENGIWDVPYARSLKDAGIDPHLASRV